jgi:hypothetical protein
MKLLELVDGDGNCPTPAGAAAECTGWGGEGNKSIRTEDPHGRIAVEIRDRIRELVRVRAGDLLDNLKNWRRHPKVQVDALYALLRNIGYVGALLARRLPNGKFMLLDGHLRAHIARDSVVPVLVIDVTDEEADQILATFDPVRTLAETDAERYGMLLDTVRIDSTAIEELLRLSAGDRLWETLHPRDLTEADVSTERADELKAKWHTESDQLWAMAPIALFAATAAIVK